jgi:hypothetical protein
MIDYINCISSLSKNLGVSRNGPVCYVNLAAKQCLHNVFEILNDRNVKIQVKNTKWTPHFFRLDIFIGQPLN